MNTRLHLKPKYKAIITDVIMSEHVKTFNSNRSIESVVRRSIKFIQSNGYYINTWSSIPGKVQYKVYKSDSSVYPLKNNELVNAYQDIGIKIERII